MNGRHEAYVKAAIEGEVARLATAVPGERNQCLFKSSAALAGLGLLEGEIIRHLKPAADEIGLRRGEFYSTVKSGVRTGHSKPRTLPQSLALEAPQTASSSNSASRASSSQQKRRPTFVASEEELGFCSDEIRRHVYRCAGEPVRIKIKRKDHYVNWYRITREGRLGWQAGKPEDYVPCPYTGALDPFDSELAGDILYWPEGEKDCDTLGNLALPAFTFGGVGDGLPDGCAEFVRNRHLIILADNDAAGRAHAEKKAQLAAGLAASIKLVEFPELPTGGDVSDYLNLSTPADLQRLVEQTPYWTAPRNPEPPAAGSGPTLLTCDLSEVAPEKVEWLWPGRIAVGKLAMIAGEPGLGKSQLSIAVAAAVTKGRRWPDSNVAAPVGNVVILSAEDGVADTIRPRFDAAGGDCSKVRVVRAVQADKGNQRTFDLVADLALLEREIRRFGNVRLIIIDPVSSYLGKIDSHKNADVRSVLAPLAEMAERLRVAVLAVTHLSKGDGKAINRIIGSIAFVAAARTTFAVIADPDDDQSLRRLFLQVKNNIAAPQPGLAFRLIQREIAPDILGSTIDWDLSYEVKIDADQALRGGARDTGGTATDDASEFLLDILAGGPVDVLDIETAARAAAMLGETKRLKESKPFRDAARKLKVSKKRIGFGPGARMQWSLADSPDHNGVQT